MILIAHRGNIDGPSEQENHPRHVIHALEAGFEAEVDVWYLNHQYWLGHDAPQYAIPDDFLNDRMWCHAKNLEALTAMRLDDVCHYFWHENDAYTLTSSGFVWTYPGHKLGSKSIAVMPETIDRELLIPSGHPFGICSDYVRLIRETRNI